MKNQIDMLIKGKWKKSEIEFLRNNYKNKTLRELAKDLNRAQSSVEYKLYHKKFGLNFKKGLIKIFPNLEHSENLAYILGVIEGDGYVNPKQYSITLNVRNKTFANSFLIALKKIDLNSKLIIYNNYDRDFYITYAASKLFYLWYKDQNFEWIKKNKKYAINFIRGMYESEGCIYYVGTSQTIIEISNTDMSLLTLCKYLLKKLNIDCKIYNATKKGTIFYIHGIKRKATKNCYKIWIGKQKNVQRFIKLIKPCIKLKPKNKINRELFLKKSRAYRKKRWEDPIIGEILRKKAKEYYKTDKFKKWKKNYQIKNKAKIIKVQKEYQKNNREKLSIYHQTYYKKNKDKINKKDRELYKIKKKKEL